MNVLLSCVGQRSYLVDYFRAAVSPHGKVIATNSRRNVPGMAAADVSRVLPPIDHTGYINALLDVALAENVGLIVPLMDQELPYLAANKDKIEKLGISVAVSSTDVVNICNDKWEMFGHLKDLGFATPKTFLTTSSAMDAIDNEEIKLPLIIKPRWGMASKCNYRVYDIDELALFHKRVEKESETDGIQSRFRKPAEKRVVIQEFVEGSEYGLDILNDMAGRPLATVVKQKLEMRAGETYAAVTIRNENLNQLGELLGAALQHRAILDVDVMVGADGVPYILDLNARFGGGYPFSHLAGARFPNAIVAMSKGRRPQCGVIRHGVVGHKFLVPQEVGFLDCHAVQADKPQHMTRVP